MSNKSITIDDIDFDVYFDFSKGCAPKLWGPPENCYPGEADEVELTGVYLDVPKGDGFDLMRVLSEEVLEQIETDILEGD